MTLPATHDVTGHCESKAHRKCQEFKGILRAGTGFHWFCACSCHPEPTFRDCAPTTPLHDFRRAHETWARARADTG